MTSNYLNDEILAELRNKVWSVQKLDLAYITGAGTILAFLNFSRYEIFRIVTDARIAIGVFFVILLVDAFISNLVFKEWIAAKTNNPKRVSSKIVIALVSLQPLIHITFITLLGIGYLSYLSGMADFQRQFETHAHIQQEVEIFLKKYGTTPDNLDDVRNKSTRIDFWIERLGDEQVQYKKTGKKSYQLLFGGFDEKIGTKDDDIVTQEQDLIV